MCSSRFLSSQFFWMIHDTLATDGCVLLILLYTEWPELNGVLATLCIRVNMKKFTHLCAFWKI